MRRTICDVQYWVLRRGVLYRESEESKRVERERESKKESERARESAKEREKQRERGAAVTDLHAVKP